MTKSKCDFLKNRMLNSKVLFNEGNIRSNKNEEDDKGKGNLFVDLAQKRHQRLL